MYDYSPLLKLVMFGVTMGQRLEDEGMPVYHKSMCIYSIDGTYRYLHSAILLSGEGPKGQVQQENIEPSNPNEGQAPRKCLIERRGEVRTG